MQSIRLLIAIMLCSLVAVSCSERIIEKQVPPPVLTPDSGTFYPNQIVKMTCAEPNAQIRYTKDGSDPTEQSILYPAGNFAGYALSALIADADSVVVTARAFMPDANPSAIVSETYKVTYFDKVATPYVYATPPGPDITPSTPISILCTTNGASIYYTINGQDPTQSSTQYTAPFTISTPGPATVRARAYLSGNNPSDVQTAEFYVNVINIPASFLQVETSPFHNGSSMVTLTNPYCIAKAEVTQAEYQAVMGDNPSSFNDPAKPVDNVTWFQAIKYCNLRSIQEGLNPAYSYDTFGNNPANWPAGWDSAANHTKISCNWNSFGYRLPSEMEWMYAARGGSYYTGKTYSGSNDLAAVGWYSGNAGSSTHAVQTKAANELGTFDQSGNVDEWVWDIFGTLPTTALYNPHGPDTGNSRCRRGGSWNSAALACTVASGRSGFTPAAAANTNGFRVVRRWN